VRVVKQLDDDTIINSGDILVLQETPIHLPPVSGIIISQTASMLSHINLLARSWGVPNAFIYNATETFKKYDGKWVNLETKPDGYDIRLASAAQVEECEQRQAARRKMMTPQADTSVTRLASLRQQRRRDAAAYGAKSANLGEVKYARLLGITVPDGFTIPFFYYDQFLRENRLDARLDAMLSDRNFMRDAAYRRKRLAEFREAVQKGKVNAELQREVVRRMETDFAGKGLFVRSSANTEDLLNFSGAGLHSTVPNVRDGVALVEAIKTVWASLWNYEAFEVREHAGIEQSKSKMAVLIQEGINADSAGVLVTTDPFNRENAGAVYINAKRGLGIRVVEGKRISEQILFNPRTSAMQVLTRSAEDSLLTFNEQGGLREAPLVGTRIVLTDELVRRLAVAGLAVKQVFGNREQDIEWVIRDGKIYIVQSRPYVLNPAGT
jgi:phosphoenolpyruvate synthase/pyruvate phosphate dikinase